MSVEIHLDDVIFNYYFLTGGFFLSYLVYKILHSLLSGNDYMHTKYRIQRHTWRSIQCNKSIPYNKFCSVCQKLMLPLVGLFCECCGASACKGCRRVIDKKFKCKSVTWPDVKPFHHHWVNVGSVPNETSDNVEDEMKRFFCSWCQRTKLCHSNAFNDSEKCDFQKYKTLIIPPSSVIMEKGKVVGLKPPPIENWEPLIVFANRKSGSNQSDEVLSLLRGILNPIQVIDLSETNPRSVVAWLPARCRVLAAGGDGTVAWVLGALTDSPHNIHAPVAILPMGTGNDLSRVFGWGGGRSSPLDAHDIIASVARATEEWLDRWQITITPLGRLGRARAPRTLYAHNYASLGVDAQVALDFHNARKQFLYRYASRTINYMAYLVLGAGRAVDAGGCERLERRLGVRLDGRRADLPPLQALLLLNIPSWAAGLDLWKMGTETVNEQSICDGKFEVVGISSSFQIARLQCGLAEPYRFAQASKIEIELSGWCAMQVDGEPWLQAPAHITVQPAGRCAMLRAHSASSPSPAHTAPHPSVP